MNLSSISSDMDVNDNDEDTYIFSYPYYESTANLTLLLESHSDERCKCTDTSYTSLNWSTNTCSNCHIQLELMNNLSNALRRDHSYQKIIPKGFLHGKSKFSEIQFDGTNFKGVGKGLSKFWPKNINNVDGYWKFHHNVAETGKLCIPFSYLMRKENEKANTKNLSHLKQNKESPSSLMNSTLGGGISCTYTTQNFQNSESCNKILEGQACFSKRCHLHFISKHGVACDEDNNSDNCDITNKDCCKVYLKDCNKIYEKDCSSISSKLAYSSYFNDKTNKCNSDSDEDDAVKYTGVGDILSFLRAKSNNISQPSAHSSFISDTNKLSSNPGPYDECNIVSIENKLPRRLLLLEDETVNQNLQIPLESANSKEKDCFNKISKKDSCNYPKLNSCLDYKAILANDGLNNKTQKHTGVSSALSCITTKAKEKDTKVCDNSVHINNTKHSSVCNIEDSTVCTSNKNSSMNDAIYVKLNEVADNTSLSIPISPTSVISPTAHYKSLISTEKPLEDMELLTDTDGSKIVHVAINHKYSETLVDPSISKLNEVADDTSLSFPISPTRVISPKSHNKSLISTEKPIRDEGLLTVSDGSEIAHVAIKSDCGIQIENNKNCENLANSSFIKENSIVSDNYLSNESDSKYSNLSNESLEDESCKYSGGGDIFTLLRAKCIANHVPSPQKIKNSNATKPLTSINEPNSIVNKEKSKLKGFTSQLIKSSNQLKQTELTSITKLKQLSTFNDESYDKKKRKHSSNERKSISKLNDKTGEAHKYKIAEKFTTRTLQESNQLEESKSLKSNSHIGWLVDSQKVVPLKFKEPNVMGNDLKTLNCTNDNAQHKRFNDVSIDSCNSTPGNHKYIERSKLPTVVLKLSPIAKQSISMICAKSHSTRPVHLSNTELISANHQAEDSLSKSHKSKKKKKHFSKTKSRSNLQEESNSSRNTVRKTEDNKRKEKKPSPNIPKKKQLKKLKKAKEHSENEIQSIPLPNKFAKRSDSTNVASSKLPGIRPKHDDCDNLKVDKLKFDVKCNLISSTLASSDKDSCKIEKNKKIKYSNKLHMEPHNFSSKQNHLERATKNSGLSEATKIQLLCSEKYFSNQSKYINIIKSLEPTALDRCNVSKKHNEKSLSKTISPLSTALLPEKSKLIDNCLDLPNKVLKGSSTQEIASNTSLMTQNKRNLSKLDYDVDTRGKSHNRISKHDKELSLNIKSKQSHELKHFAATELNNQSNSAKKKKFNPPFLSNVDIPPVNLPVWDDKGEKVLAKQTTSLGLAASSSAPNPIIQNKLEFVFGESELDISGLDKREMHKVRRKCDAPSETMTEIKKINVSLERNSELIDNALYIIEKTEAKKEKRPYKLALTQKQSSSACNEVPNSEKSLLKRKNRTSNDINEKFKPTRNDSVEFKNSKNLECGEASQVCLQAKKAKTSLRKEKKDIFRKDAQKDLPSNNLKDLTYPVGRSNLNLDSEKSLLKRKTRTPKVINKKFKPATENDLVEYSVSRNLDKCGKIDQVCLQAKRDITSLRYENKDHARTSNQKDLCCKNLKDLTNPIVKRNLNSDSENNRTSKVIIKKFKPDPGNDLVEYRILKPLELYDETNQNVCLQAKKDKTLIRNVHEDLVRKDNQKDLPSKYLKDLTNPVTKSNLNFDKPRLKGKTRTSVDINKFKPATGNDLVECRISKHLELCDETNQVACFQGKRDKNSLKNENEGFIIKGNEKDLPSNELNDLTNHVKRNFNGKSNQVEGCLLESKTLCLRKGSKKLNLPHLQKGNLSKAAEKGLQGKLKTSHKFSSKHIDSTSREHIEKDIVDEVTVSSRDNIKFDHLSDKFNSDYKLTKNSNPKENLKELDVSKPQDCFVVEKEYIFHVAREILNSCNKVNVDETNLFHEFRLLCRESDIDNIEMEESLSSLDKNIRLYMTIPYYRNYQLVGPIDIRPQMPLKEYVSRLGKLEEHLINSTKTN